jgi:hypothetical protein
VRVASLMTVSVSVDDVPQLNATGIVTVDDRYVAL